MSGTILVVSRKGSHQVSHSTVGSICADDQLEARCRCAVFESQHDLPARVSLGRSQSFLPFDPLWGKGRQQCFFDLGAVKLVKCPSQHRRQQRRHQQRRHGMGTPCLVPMFGSGTPTGGQSILPADLHPPPIETPCSPANPKPGGWSRPQLVRNPETCRSSPPPS